MKAKGGWLVIFAMSAAIGGLDDVVNTDGGVDAKNANAVHLREFRKDTEYVEG